MHHAIRAAVERRASVLKYTLIDIICVIVAVKKACRTTTYARIESICAVV
jgi:hypothetical protein